MYSVFDAFILLSIRAFVNCVFNKKPPYGGLFIRLTQLYFYSVVNTREAKPFL